ncbi:uncharacterized protein, partial [Clytia hemisphaerica]|uniref:uncharacterized protein n=1 Tax=Clytia hemisphaerica TaxID=252671 RepID=UPI0034D616C8
MKVTPFYQPSIPEINEQLMLLTKISAYFGLPSKFSWINVISFKRQPNENQITIAWTNCTLTGKQCHNKDVSTIASKVVLDNGQPNSVFARFLSPQYIINEIRATTSSQCQQTTTSTLQPTSSVIGSSYPIIVNNMPTLEVTTLNYFTYKIPFNTFYDSTDGYTPYLTLSMSSNAGKPIPRSSWIQFNAAAQEINAFLYVDILNGREVENFQFVLTATNSFARSKNMVINIQCRRKVFPMGGFYVEFSGREYFNQIMNNIQVLTILLQRYFQYTGNRYKTEIVCFQRNTGLNFRMNFVYHRVIDSSNGCNVTELYNLQKILLTNQGQINSDFMFAFLPEAVASHVTITTFGSCLNLPTTTPSTPQPVILNQIQPLVISNAGFFQYSIPEKTFYDAKDGFTPMMQLKLLDQYKTGVRKDSWITLSNNQVILASPSGMQFPNTRTNQFYLRVINSQLKFTDLALEVTVINQSPVGALRITLTGVHKFQSSSSTVDIIIYIMEKLNSYLYDQTNRKETVLISFYHSSSTFTMHLDDASLIGDICSSNTFRTLEKKIYITPGNIHPQMVMELFPQVSLTQVQFSKQCNRPITTSKPTTTEKQNTPPYVNQPIQPIHISFGRLLFKYISPQTFLDREDGDARHLQLTLLHNDGGTVQRDNWVQMNQNTLLIYGSYTLQDYNMLPLDKYRYMLRATDSKGSFTATPIIFERPSTSLEYSFKIRTTITMFYDSTTSLVNEQILFITKINSYITTYLRYGIQIITFARSILTKQLIIEWALDNLSDDICPWQTLQLITDKFVSNSQPSSGYRSIMRPEYSVSSVEIQRMPSCQQITISPSPSSTTTHLQTSTSIPTTPIPEPPTINTNIFPIRLSTKQSAIFIYYIPSNAFNNPMNSHLKLDLLTEEGRQLENRSWVSFNKQHNYIYGMLIEDMITSGSSDVYRLQATNGGGSVYSQVTITIPALEKKLHSITIVFRTRDTFFKYADLTALVIGQLSLYLRQSGVINLLSIIKMQGNFWSVQFAASTQIVDYCNMQQYFTFRRKFVVDTLVSTLFKNFVYPEMEVLQAYASNEQCQNVTTTTTTTPTPNVNLPPTVLKLFAKVTATTCEVFEFQIPNNSFFDVEDGLTSNLAITIQEPDGGELPKDVWLVFNETTRTLRGLLTLTEAVNSNQFVYRVVATDKAGLSVFQMLTIHVSKPQNEVDGHMVETYGTILQQIETNALKLLIHQKFLSYIQQKFTQGSVNGLQIHSMIIYPTNPKSMNLKWSICQRQCNQNVDIELKRILMVQNIQPNYDVMVLLHPTAHVTSVSITGDTKCRTTTTTTTTPTKVTPSPNTPPTINRVIPILTVEGCKLLDYQIPHDTCFDKEDGYTAKLHIKLLHENKTEVGDSSWIHLNHATQKIYGILKISDLEGSPNNVFIFYLVCQDSGGLSVEHRFYILPSGTPMMPKYHFTMKSYIYVNEMMSDSEIQLLWIKRMKRYLGETEYNLQLIDMKRTTILYPQITIKWYNCSIQDPCSQDALHLKSLLLNDKNHHSLNEQFSRSMVPEFVLISGAMEQQQPCQVITTTTGTPALTTTPPVNQIPITVMKVLKVEIDVCEQVLYQIPANAFFDVEDGYTRNLKLSLTNKDDSKVDELCINFDKGAQTIYFRYVKDLFQNNLELKLTAMDSGGGSATSDLVITTKANVAELSHWFSMRSYVYNIVPQKLNILNSFTAKLQHFFSDKSGGQIMFKKLSYTDNYMEVEWSNCSLYTTCKNSSLLQMKSKMLMFDSSSIVNPQFISFMAPSFVITFLQMQYGDICYPHPSTTVVPTPSTQVTPQPSVTPTHGLNTPPRVMKEIPVYNVPLCALFSFRIPQDTFYDREDGGTRNLRLELRQFNDQELASTSWIQFVESTQVVYGQFRQEGNNMDSKYISYILRAYDRSSLNTFTVITMKTPPMDTVPYFIEAEFTRFYDENTPELISQLFLTSKISTYLGEQNVGNVLAISYKRTPNTIELSWTNCRLIDRSCQNNEVQDNISKFATNGVDQINDGFRRAMDPYYIVKKVLVNTSNCDKLPRTTIIPSPSSSMYPSMSSIFTNRPPRVNGIIEPIPLKKCGSFSYTIPNNLFIDEDGNTRNLRIQFFDIYGNEVNNRTSWVQYNPKLFLIYGLIKCSDIEKQPDAGYQYILEASDSQGLSVFTILPFQKLDQITRIGFEIEMEIECSFDAVTPYLNDIFQIINKIVFFFGDHNMDNIKVVKFFEKPGSIGTIIFKWTNCTFDFTTCPTDQIELLVQKITSSNGAFAKSFEPNYRVKSIEYVYNTPCQKPTTTLAPTTTPLPSPPKVVNYISTIITKRCANLHFPIPEKTFYDDEDGWTRNLTLLLMTVTDEKLSSGSWIQFDQQSQTIIGRPAKLTNIPDPYQSFIYNLVAMDKEGNQSPLVIRIDVLSDPKPNTINQNFTLILKKNFPINIPDVKAYKERLKTKIASYYGDTGSYFINEIDFASNSKLLTAFLVELYTRLIKDKIMDLSGKCRTQFAFIFLPEFTVKELTMQINSDCGIITSTITPTTAALVTPSSSISPMPDTTIKVLVDEINIPVDYCKQVEYMIPENIFHDEATGNSRSFTYSLLYEDKLTVTCSSWLQLNVTSGNELYGNMLQTQPVNPVKYKLRALNEVGASATSDILIDTTQLEKLNISYRAAFSFQTTLDEKICDAELLFILKEKLKTYFGDDTTSYTSFFSFFSRGTKQQPSYVMWTNCTIRTDICDFRHINEITDKLFVDDQSLVVKPALIEALKPEFTDLSVLEEKLGPCDANEVLSVGLSPDPICVDTCGEFIYKLNDSMFIDPEDGNTSKLIIEMTNKDSTPLAPNSWIQFDQVNKEIFGFPSESVIVNEPSEGYVYLINAYDSQGAAASVPVTFKMCRGLPSYDGSVTVKLKCNKTITKAIHIVEDTLHRISEAYYDGTLADFFLVNYQLKMNDMNFTWTNCTGSVDFDLEQLQNSLNDSDCQPINVTITDHKDYPPIVVRDNLRFDISFCHPKNYTIPFDSIVDGEDGDLRNMTVYLAFQNMQPLPSDYFVALYKDSLEVIFMATNQTKSKIIYEYYLVAVDKRNQTARMMLYFEVMDDFPPVNYLIGTKLRAPSNIATVQSINDYFDAINQYMNYNSTWLVNDYQGFSNGTIIIRYTQCTHSYPKCDHKNIETFRSTFMSEDGQINPDVIAAMFPRFRIQSIDTERYKDCLLEPNTPPEKHHNLNVTIKRCGITKYRIPEDTFFDKEDGNTGNLTLKLYRDEDTQCWLKFNATDQQMTLLYDSGKAGQTFNFTIQATDVRGESVNATLTVFFEERGRISYQLVFLFDIVETLPCFEEKYFVSETMLTYFNNTEEIGVASISKGPDNLLMEVVVEHCDMDFSPCNYIVMDRLTKALQDGNSLKREFIDSFSTDKYIPRYLSQRKGEPCLDRSNTAPLSQGEIGLVNVTACTNQTDLFLPRDLVMDNEDGDWSNMKKVLYKVLESGGKTLVTSKDWIQMNGVSIMIIYVRSLANAQPEEGYHFLIDVTDSRGSQIEVPLT